MGKPNSNPYAVGKQLKIGKEIFDDLDEIYCNYRPRLNQWTQLMIQHKNFRYGSEEDIRDMLIEEMEAKSKTCYALSYSYRHEGHFLLSYIIASSSSNSTQNWANFTDKQKKKRVQKEYIGLTYLGYKFRKNYFDDPGKLINWFKQNFKKNHPKYSKQNGGQRRGGGYGQNGGAGAAQPAYHGSLNDDGGYQHQQNNNAQFHHHPDRPQPGGGGYYPPPPQGPPHYPRHQQPPPHGGGYGGGNGYSQQQRRHSRSQSRSRGHPPPPQQ